MRNVVRQDSIHLALLLLPALPPFPSTSHLQLATQSARELHPNPGAEASHKHHEDLRNAHCPCGHHWDGHSCQPHGVQASRSRPRGELRLSAGLVGHHLRRSYHSTTTELLPPPSAQPQVASSNTTPSSRLLYSLQSLQVVSTSLPQAFEPNYSKGSRPFFRWTKA